MNKQEMERNRASANRRTYSGWGVGLFEQDIR